MKQITLPARIDCLKTLNDFVSENIHGAGINGSQKNKILFAVEEIFLNIANYAYIAGDGDATIRINVEVEQIILEFRDSGKPFNILEKEDPNLNLDIENRETGGLGIYMVKRIMDEVYYEYNNGQNVLTICKNV